MFFRIEFVNLLDFDYIYGDDLNRFSNIIQICFIALILC